MKEGEVADKNRGRSVDDDGDDRPDDVDDELEPLSDDDADDVDDEANDLDDDATDDDADDDTDDDTDDADAAAGAEGRRARARKRKVGAGASAGAVARTKSKDAKRGGGGGIFGRVARFVREIVAELQKVIWPTRKELLTYTTVVVVFVAIMMTFVSLLDVGFAKVMFLVFGGNTTDTATTTTN